MEGMHMRSGRRSALVRGLVIVAVFGLTAAACSEDPEPAAPTQEPSPTESEAPSPTEEPEPAAATVEVEASDLGDIVVDAEGRTLYVFLADEGSESTCYDDCEAAWPPLTVEGEPVAGEGIDASLLGTSERTDGSAQVTLDGHPLYYFGQDAAPGDVNGQGVGDVWYVVSPAGAPIQ
jgi:predicted lipoprotein with Yx(FWY)xxD motif